MWVTIVLLSGLTGALCASLNPNVRAVSMDTIIADFFRQGDKDNDGIYSLAEAWTEILAMDRDGDNKVSLAEYTARIHSIDPSMVPEAPNFFAKEDMNKDGYIDQQDVNKIYALVDTDGNGQVTMLEFSVFFKKFFGGLGFGTTIPTPTGSTANKTMDAMLMEMFKQGDTNHDGIYSLDEAFAATLAMDLNGDEKIYLPEYVVALHDIAPMLVPQAANIFAKEDGNHDGFISRKDVTYNYGLVDTNHDGNVTLSEFMDIGNTLFADLGTTGPPPTGVPANKSMDAIITELFNQGDKNNDSIYSLSEAWADVLIMDLNGDQKIGLPEYTARLFQIEPSLVPVAPNIFAKEDINHDGFIDRNDLDKIYATIDTNGDGQVTLSEYTTFAKKFLAELGLAGNGPTTMDPTATMSAEAEIMELFHAVDKDGNKAISLEEQWAQVSHLDFDGDGKITFEEYSAAIRNVTNDPRIFAELRRDFNLSDIDNDGYFEMADLQIAFSIADLNGDGHLSLSEFINYDRPLRAGVTLTGTTGTPIPLDTVFDTVYHQVDTNKNGQLSFDEVWASFLPFDTDGDGKISWDEYMKNETNDPSALARAEATFQSYDHNQNKYLEQDDIRIFFKDADSDGDGEISETEYINHAKQFYANLGMIIEGFTPAPGALVNLDPFVNRTFQGIDTDGNGIISFNEEWASILQFDQDGDKRITLEEYLVNTTNEEITLAQAIFDRFDYDRNGYFDESDIRLGYDFLDTDSDGQVSYSEVAGFLKQFFANLGVAIEGYTPAPGSNNVTLDAVLGAAFHSVDKNGDGILSFEEQWTQTILLDTNGDQNISLAEYLVSFENATSDAFGRAIFKEIDVNHDGYFNQSELRLAIRNLDTNGDGNLVQSEFVGSLKQLYFQSSVTDPGVSVSTSPTPS